MEAYAASEMVLPGAYDELSGQPRTYRRDICLLHDMAAQMMRLHAERIEQIYPHG